MQKSKSKTGQKPQKKSKAAITRSQRDIPAAIAYSSRAQPPNIGNRVVLKRREFVGTATNGSTTGFALTNLSTVIPGYDFNPSCYTLFPWLSQLSVAYERFRFNKLSFEFVPGQSTATAGRFYASVDYDYDDNPATSKAEMMGNMTAVESSLWTNCGLKCDPNSLNRDMPYRYVSSTSRTLSIENRTAYSGFLMLAFDTAVTNCIMDIWVEYECELITPVLDSVQFQVLPISSTATVDVCPTLGTKAASSPPVSTNSFPLGAAALVTPGQSGVPTMSRGFWGNTFIQKSALDIKNLLNLPSLILSTNASAYGVAPSALMDAATALQGVFNIYDSKGTWLVDTSGSSEANGVTRCTGLATSGSIFVPGATVLTSTALQIAKLLTQYPTMRYIGAMLQSDVPVGPGMTGWGFTAQK